MAKSYQAESFLTRAKLSQVSMEYLFIVALTFAIMIPAAYLFFNYSRGSTQEISDAQIIKLGRSVVDASETIFYSGQGSRTVLDLNIPKGISSVLIIDGKELVFNITTSFGVSEIVFFSAVNLTTIGGNCNANVCILPGFDVQGLKKLRIETINKNSVSLETV